jgi:hypothetical protein
MKPTVAKSIFIAITLAALSSILARVDDPLASWNDGSAKQAVLEFVKATRPARRDHVAPYCPKVL